MKERDDTAPYIVLCCPFLVDYVGKGFVGGEGGENVGGGTKELRA